MSAWNGDYPITCHAGHPMAHLGGMEWRPPRVTSETVEVEGEEVLEGNWSAPFRTCDFCGSIHPLDLLEVFGDEGFERVRVTDFPHRAEAGAEPLVQSNVSWADMKYGYPHKLYVHGIPNPIAGRKCIQGSQTKDGETTPIVGTASETTWAKFYTKHLFDEGLTAQPEALTAVVDAIARESGLQLVIYVDPENGNRIGWTKP